MMRRIWTLSRYFNGRLTHSLSGLLYLIATLVFWAVMFNPGQGSPDFDHYFLMIGGFGAAMAFLVTLTITSQSNRAENYPLLVRLPSRVEYLTAVFIAAFVVVAILQGLMAVLSLYNGPSPSISQWMQIPPIWISFNILAIVLALHASDLATDGWSRVYFYTAIAVLLFINGTGDSTYRWVSQKLTSLGYTLSNNGMGAIAGVVNRIGAWINDSGGDILHKFSTLIFWPFTAITNAIAAGYFTPTQALAPAVLLLYATVFYLLAADLFANKDVEFVD